MARKKAEPTKSARKKYRTKKVSSKRTTQSKSSRAIKTGSSRSYINLIYGFVTVVVIFLLAFFAIRTFTQRTPGEITPDSAQTTEEEPFEYTVLEGDTLWSIAEAELGSGFRWNELAQANNIANPSQVTKGTKLIIPESASTEAARITQKQQNTETPTVTSGVTQTATVSPSPTEQLTQTVSPSPTVVQSAPAEKISGAQYTVRPGDNLWDICVRAYGNGYKWVEVARVNNLENPDLIFSGNKLQLPRD